MRNIIFNWHTQTTCYSGEPELEVQNSKSCLKYLKKKVHMNHNKRLSETNTVFVLEFGSEDHI